VLIFFGSFPATSKNNIFYHETEKTRYNQAEDWKSFVAIRHRQIPFAIRWVPLYDLDKPRPGCPVTGREDAMREIVLFALGLVLSFMYIFQVRHFIRDEGDSLFDALTQGESVVYGFLGLVAWTAFIIDAFYH